jgi:hypothetical protein
VEGQTISASGGKIDVDLLTAGVHTVTLTAADLAGNLTTVSLTFTIKVTAPGLKAALADGLARGWVPGTAAFQATLTSQLQAVVDAASKPGNGNTAAVRLRSFISTVTGATSAQITTAFRALLLSWSNDLLTRL